MKFVKEFVPPAPPPPQQFKVLAEPKEDGKYVQISIKTEYGKEAIVGWLNFSSNPCLMLNVCDGAAFRELGFKTGPSGRIALYHEIA